MLPRTTAGFSTTQSGKVKCQTALLSSAWRVHNLASTEAMLPSGPRAGGEGHPREACTHACRKASCPPPSELTGTSPHTTEPWRELRQALRVKTAGLGQLQALQVLLENLPPFLPKTGEEDRSLGLTCLSHSGDILHRSFIVCHDHSL